MTRREPARTLSINLGTDIADPHRPQRTVALGFEWVTETVAIIARKGAGKTHTARCMVEDMLDGGAQVVVIDPLDVWWGLRLAADGKGDGRNVVILGGTHADLPLVETAGSAIADLVVDRGLSVVLVLDHLSLAAQRRFMADFAEQLFQRKSAIEHRSPVHLVIDEADTFAPQRVQPDMAKCVGMVDRIVRRGRSRGLGTTCITQRPAVLSKDVLTQTEMLICLQVTAPQDRAALTEWIRANADEAQAKTFLGSLAGLGRGEAWVWSPAKLRTLVRVKIRGARTYDSSYTPEFGSKRVDPPRLTPTDLRAIEQDLAAVIERVKANDPAELRKQIAELRSKLAAKPTSEPKPGELERAVAKALKARDGSWRKAIEAAQRAILKQVNIVVAEAMQGTGFDVVLDDTHTGLIEREVVQERAPRLFTRAEPEPHTHVHTSAPALDEQRDAGGLPKAERLILSALAAQPHGRTRESIARATLYAPGGGGFLNALSALRTKRYIQGTLGDPAVVKITPEGLAALGQPSALPAGASLREAWSAKLGKAERAILHALAHDVGTAMSKEDVAKQTGYQAGGGGFLNALSRLRSLGLIHGKGVLALDEELT